MRNYVRFLQIGSQIWLLVILMSEVEEVVAVSAGQSTEASARAGGVREATFYKWKYRQY